MARWVVVAALVVVTAHRAHAEAATKNAPPQQAAQPQAAPPQPARSVPAPQQPPSPPPQPRCAPAKGTPIFEARYTSAGQRTVITRLYASGTYTHVEPKRVRSACVDKKRAAELAKILAASPWRTLKTEVACADTTAEKTEIYTAGTLRFTAKTCNPLVLDEKSNAALDRVTSYVGPFGIDMVAGQLE